MRISTTNVRAQVAECRSAESELEKLGAQIRAQRAELAEAEAEFSSRTHDAKSFNAEVGKLEGKRRSISDLEYRAALLDRTVSRCRGTLQQSGAALAAEARAQCTELRDRVMSELRRRIAPFLDPKFANSAIRVGDVRCLRAPIKLSSSLEGHTARLKTDPAAACAVIVDKVDALAAAAAEIEAKLA